MTVSREEALQAVDNLFNYCEEIDHSLPENEQTGYKMLPDINKIRKYIFDNSHPRGEWVKFELGNILDPQYKCPVCGDIFNPIVPYNYCPNCGADMRKEGEQK